MRSVPSAASRRMTDVWSARIRRPASSVPFTKSEPQVAQRRRLEAEVVEGGQLRGQPLGAGQPVRLLEGQGQLAGQRGEQVQLLVGEGAAAAAAQRRARPGSRRRRARGPPAREAVRARAAPAAASPRAAPSAAARRASRASAGGARPPPPPAAAPPRASGRVEGDAVVAEVGVDALRPPGAAATCGRSPPPSRPRARPRAPGARRAAAGGRRSAGCAGTTPRGRRRCVSSCTSASVKPPGLLTAAMRPSDLALRDHGHQHDRLRAR